MPVILPEDQLDAWLSGEVGEEILVPYPATIRRSADQSASGLSEE
jgi:hypothetical protein